MGVTKIGWSQMVWNPITGCSHVSEGCRHCYAEAVSLRHGWSVKPWTAQNAAENVVLHPDRLDQPLRWQKPRMVFVCSMADLFHEQVPDGFIDRVFAVMALAGAHTFQVLTKRPERMRCWFTSTASGAMRETIIYEAARSMPYKLRGEWATFRWPGWPLPNVWLGASVEDQCQYNERVEAVRQSGAVVRFLSCEPLLGSIDFGDDFWESGNRVDWVIVGGESGPGHSPMELSWLTSIVEQCRAVNIPVFVKQDSGQYPGRQGHIPDRLWIHEYPPRGIRR